MALQWDDPKDPNEVLDYIIDWSERLASGETIGTSAWTITGSDSVLVEDSNSISGETTVIWVSAGTLGVTYTLTNRITTSQGRTMDQSSRLKIKAK
jgi:hypothetical protein